MRKGVIYSIFLFIIILGFNLFLYPSTLDEIWNYGFSYNILNVVLPSPNDVSFISRSMLNPESGITF